MIIEKLLKKIKAFVDESLVHDLMWLCILVALVLGSFSLGIRYERKRLLQQQPLQISVHQESVDIWNAYQADQQKNMNFFASKNGSVVYPVGCTAGNRVSEENKVFFESIEEAEALGYRASAQC